MYISKQKCFCSLLTVLPRIPKDVSIQNITSFAARVGWSAAASSSQPQAYHVELTTSSDNVVTRISSEKRSVTFTHLQPDTLYHVRVQAENRAGNGSSSSFVAFTTKARKIFKSTLLKKTLSFMWWAHNTNVLTEIGVYDLQLTSHIFPLGSYRFLKSSIFSFCQVWPS